MVCKYFLPFHRLLFHSVFPLLWRSFLIWCNLTCLFSLLLPVLLVFCSQNQCQEAFLPVLSSNDFIVSGLTFKYLTHFELMFVFGVRCSISFFCMWMFSFPHTTYWRDYHFPIVYTWPLCWRLIDHKCVHLFLGSLFSSFGLYVCFYANTIMFWLL